MYFEFWLMGTAVLYTWVGMRFASKKNEEVIENTIDFLIKNNYLNADKNPDGSFEIKKLNE